MEIEINGDSRLAQAEPGSSVAEVVDRIREVAASQDVVIASMALDGEPFSESLEKEVADRRVEDFDLLEVEVRSPLDLVRSTWNELRVVLPEMRGAALDTAALLEAGGFAEGVERLKAFSEEVRLVLESISDGVVLLNRASLPVGLPPEQLRDEVGRHANLLREIAAGIRDRDSVRLADALEYEWVPCLERLERLITRWVEALPSEPPASPTGTRPG